MFIYHEQMCPITLKINSLLKSLIKAAHKNPSLIGDR